MTKRKNSNEGSSETSKKPKFTPAPIIKWDTQPRTLTSFLSDEQITQILNRLPIKEIKAFAKRLSPHSTKTINLFNTVKEVITFIKQQRDNDTIKGDLNLYKTIASKRQNNPFSVHIMFEDNLYSTANPEKLGELFKRSFERRDMVVVYHLIKTKTQIIAEKIIKLPQMKERLSAAEYLIHTTANTLPSNQNERDRIMQLYSVMLSKMKISHMQSVMGKILDQLTQSTHTDTVSYFNSLFESTLYKLPVYSIKTIIVQREATTNTRESAHQDILETLLEIGDSGNYQPFVTFCRKINSSLSPCQITQSLINKINQTIKKLRTKPLEERFSLDEACLTHLDQIRKLLLDISRKIEQQPVTTTSEKNLKVVIYSRMNLLPYLYIYAQKSIIKEPTSISHHVNNFRSTNIMHSTIKEITALISSLKNNSERIIDQYMQECIRKLSSQTTNMNKYHIGASLNQLKAFYSFSRARYFIDPKKSTKIENTLIDHIKYIKANIIETFVESHYQPRSKKDYGVFDQTLHQVYLTHKFKQIATMPAAPVKALKNIYNAIKQSPSYKLTDHETYSIVRILKKALRLIIDKNPHRIEANQTLDALMPILNIIFSDNPDGLLKRMTSFSNDFIILKTFYRYCMLRPSPEPLLNKTSIPCHLRFLIDTLHTDHILPISQYSEQATTMLSTLYVKHLKAHMLSILSRNFKSAVKIIQLCIDIEECSILCQTVIDAHRGYVDLQRPNTSSIKISAKIKRDVLKYCIPKISKQVYKHKSAIKASFQKQYQAGCNIDLSTSSKAKVQTFSLWKNDIDIEQLPSSIPVEVLSTILSPSIYHAPKGQSTVNTNIIDLTLLDVEGEEVDSADSSAQQIQEKGSSTQPSGFLSSEATTRVKKEPEHSANLSL